VYLRKEELKAQMQRPRRLPRPERNYKMQSSLDNNLLFKQICGVLMRKNRYIKPEIAEKQESMLMIRSRTASTNSYNKKVYQENLRILD